MIDQILFGMGAHSDALNMFFRIHGTAVIFTAVGVGMVFLADRWFFKDGK